MAIELWWIGKDKKDKTVEVYLKRIGRYTNFRNRHLKESKQKDPVARVEEEGLSVLQQLQNGDHLVLMDEKGSTYTSISFARRLNDQWLRQRRTIFLIGGAFGHSPAVQARANELLALSQLTFPHELARLILTEQIYRAFTILNNEKYHHE